MTATLSIGLTVTLDGVSLLRTPFASSISLTGTILRHDAITVGQGTIKTLFDLSDASFSDQLADFDFLLVRNANSDAAENKVFLEVTVDRNNGVGDEILTVELPKGAVYLLFGNGGMANRTTAGGALSTTGNIGTIDSVESARVYNASASMDATIDLLVVT